MLESEKFALAARLHVSLRRKVGRVTDVEWMVKNTDYAREIVRFAREQNEAELAELADKLEAALLPPKPAGASPAAASAGASAGASAAPSAVLGDLRDLASAALSAVQPASASRYVGSLR
jgi:hypothetical protein